MNYLVDTHIFLWSLFQSKKLPKEVRNILINPDLTQHISVISFWEISLKFALNKIDLSGILPDHLPELARKSGFKILDLETDIAASFYKLSQKGNKDPFDRMLAWQAICKNYLLLTQDKSFVGYENQGLNVRCI